MRPSAGNVLLHDLFDRRLDEIQDRTALEIPPGSHGSVRIAATYGQLARASQAVASQLRPIARTDSIVATLLPRTSIEAFAAPLGILRAGCAYTCIDPMFPDVRVADLIEDSQALAVLTDADGRARLSRLGIDPERVLVADVSESSNHSAASEPLAGLTAASLAYLIYTSGTTGVPKGVMIEHRAIVNLIESDIHEFGLGPADRVSQNSSHAYDSSIEETWLAFSAGATLVVMDDEVARSGPDLVSWLERERISVLCPTPTMLRATGCRTADGLLPRLRMLYLGGEALTADDVSVWAPGRRMINGYGPTENAVTCIRTDVHAGTIVTIGRPIPNVTAHVLDQTLAEVANGDQGELCLGGSGLARGYWRDDELTARKFPHHPSLGRLYRTGDLATRAADGTITCLGRVDSQVKIRGYRIELEEIETRLAASDGVRGAACRVQMEGNRATLVGFVVPADPASPPDLDRIQRALSESMPAHMVPAHLRVIDALPQMSSGKLNRAALPSLETDTADPTGAAAAIVPPRTAMEARIEAALRLAVGRTSPISITANFFEDLGGDSLLAAQLITALRADPDTGALTVRDAYDAPTIEQLAHKAAGLVEVRPTPPRPLPAGGGRPILTTVLQVAWLATGVIIGSAAACFAVTIAWPLLFAGASPLAIAIGVPIAGVAALLCYIPISLAIVVAIKRGLIGKYQPGQWVVWGSFYARHWAVCQALRIVPWRFLEGTVFQVMALRALGARIGQRVHIHRGVDLLQGGWDLLTIGDDVMIGQEAMIRVVELEDEELVAGPITIESEATIETRASVAVGATIRAGGYLTALSSLPEGATIPRGERWDGVPAARAGVAPATPRIDASTGDLSPTTLGAVMLASRLIGFMFVPTLIIWTALFVGEAPLRDLLFAPGAWGLVIVISLAVVPTAMIAHAIAIRLLGRVQPGVINRWSRDYLRVWVKTDIVRRAGDWLSGTLMWPIWLRAAGMQIGRDCEISTIIDVVPELVTIGPSTFFADGVYLAGPKLHRGTVTLAQTHLGSEVFLGNNVVIPAGARVADRVLIGVSTVAGEPMTRAGSSWFGHPPFALARPEPPAVDKRLTHHPSLIRYVNRWVWELGRFAIPTVSALVLLVCARMFVTMRSSSSDAWTAFVVAPGLVALAATMSCGFVLAVKWLLLGRVRPGQHALWSCWCSRWDFMYTVWDRLATPFLTRFDGTLVLAWYLRAMGMRIGRRVLLGPGFAQVVDPDMIEIEDDATVHAMFQAHSFEDRVLKIDRVRIGRRATVGCGAVLFYGVDVGDGASVAAQSVIMKHERLLPHQRYEGCPSARVAEESVA